jgi:hypothetical protein
VDLKELVREVMQTVIKTSATDQVSVFGVCRAMGCLRGPFVGCCRGFLTRRATLMVWRWRGYSTQQHNNTTTTQQHNNTATQQHNNTTTQQRNNATTQEHNNTISGATGQFVFVDA